MLNIWIDSFARAGGIESGTDARHREPMPPASEVDALPEPAIKIGNSGCNSGFSQVSRIVLALLHLELPIGH